MNCTQALEQLLDADLDAPSSEQDRALAAHIAECGRCARAAATLRTGTMALAQTVARERTVAARPVAVSAGIGRLAPRFVLVGAALAMTVFLIAQAVITESVVRASTDMATGAIPPQPIPAPTGPVETPPATPVAPRVSRVPRTVAATPERVEPRFFSAEPVKATAVEATPFVIANSANALPVAPENHADAARLPEITVTNRLGTHAMVSRTADPNIVVVWLSSEPTRRNP